MPLDKTLNRSDYTEILQFYNIPSAGLSTAEIKHQAEDILANKLCRCIKKLERTMKRPLPLQNGVRTRAQTRAANVRRNPVAVCKDSVLRKKGLRIYTFKCKNKRTINPPKSTRRKLKIFKI